MDQLDESIFEDIFSRNNSFHHFDQQSQSSILDDMVDAIMDENKPELLLLKHSDSVKSSLIDNNENINLHHSIDHWLLFDIPQEEEDKDDLSHRDNSRTTSATAKNIAGEKIFKISSYNKKLVDNSK